LEKLGQADRAKAIFAELVDNGGKALGGGAEAKTPIPPVASPAQRARVADAHYLVGLGQLGMNHQEQARQEFSLALEASPDHYAAMRVLNDRTP
jgi:Tfp pilus assembly protein PilF